MRERQITVMYPSSTSLALKRNGAVEFHPQEINRPCNLDAERLVIGACISDSAALASVARFLPASAFSLDKNRLIFTTVLALAGSGVAPNVTTVANALNDSQLLQSAGGVSYLAELIDVRITAGHLDSCIKIVAEKNNRWRALIFCEGLSARLNGSDDTAQVLTEARAQLEDLGASSRRPGSIVVSDLPSVHSIGNSDMLWAVDRIFAFGAITGVTGDAGAGKTTFVTSAGGHIATGLPFLGRNVVQTDVLILDRENSLPVLQERLRRLGIQDGSALRIWGGHNTEAAPSPGAAAVLEYVAACDPKPVIVVDSLVAFLECDENDATEVRAFMSQLRKLADMGAAVIVLHHSGKGETSRDYRGSSDIKASIDIGFLLTNLGEGGLDRLRLKAFKTRFSVDSDLILGYSDGQFTCDERPNAVTATVSEQLTKLLREMAPVKTKVFEDEVARRGLGRDRARKFLSDGVHTGHVRLESGPHNTKLYRPAIEDADDIF